MLVKSEDFASFELRDAHGSHKEIQGFKSRSSLQFSISRIIQV